MASFEVVVIDGVIGSSITYHLARQGRTVLVVERAAPAAEPAVSWASAGEGATRLRRSLPLKPSSARRQSIALQLQSESCLVLGTGDSMQKIIGATDLQRHFKATLDEVVSDHVRFVLSRGSRPEAALISYDDFLRFQQLEARERQFIERWERSQERLAAANAHLSDEEIEAEVAAAVQEVRTARRARRQATAS